MNMALILILILGIICGRGENLGRNLKETDKNRGKTPANKDKINLACRKCINKFIEDVKLSNINKFIYVFFIYCHEILGFSSVDKFSLASNSLNLFQTEINSTIVDQLLTKY